MVFADSIMVEVRYRDRLGNNMFQYALGRIIAQELGFALVADAIEGFSRTYDVIEGRRTDTPVQVLNDGMLDLQAVLANRNTRRIVLDGWFQRLEYYASHKDRIREWFSFDLKDDIPCDADVVVHVRRTDYVDFGWALPFGFYREAIERSLPTDGKLVIVTDDPSDVFNRHFDEWRPKFLEGSALQQMSYMCKAPNLIISASTFSWWPAFLGEHQTVVCPVPSQGIWAPDNFANTKLIDQEGFICLSCSESYKPDLAERLYQEYRLLKKFVKRSVKWAERRVKGGFTKRFFT